MGADQSGENIQAVRVIAAGLWTAPEQVRDIDEPALGNPARVRDWSAAQGPEQRRGLWGRLESQVLLGERVIVDDVRDGWARVVVPAQPSSKDPRGYPGWIPLAQLGAPAAETGESVVVTHPTTDLYADPSGPVAVADVSFATVLPLLERVDDWLRVALPDGESAWVRESDVEPVDTDPPLPTAEQLIEAGRQFLGLTYLAAGAHGLTLDCSGLLHLLYRRFGHTVPRDARDKIAVGEHVTIEDLQPGDLMFFANPETGFVYHCGICTTMPSMLHVSQTDWACVDGELSDVRRDHLISGRRLRR
jgi:cell wall-associated NlpC family hydrolase